MDNYHPESGTDDARSEGGQPSEARRNDLAQGAAEAINENGGYPRSSEDRVRDRAYSLWEKEGRPDGAHDDHWHRAKRELTDEQLSAGDPSPSGP